MNQVVPWAALVALIAPFARGAHQALGGRLPFPIETMLRIHCLQLWWNLSDPAMEEELHERPLYRRFAGLDGAARMSVRPRIVPTGNSMLPILKPLKACSTFAWLGSGSRYRTSRKTPATRNTRMGVRRDQNKSRGRIRTQTSNMGFSKQTGRAEGRSFRQTAKARWQAAGCLGGVCIHANPGGRCDKGERRTNPSRSGRSGGLRSLWICGDSRCGHAGGADL